MNTTRTHAYYVVTESNTTTTGKHNKDKEEKT